MIPAPYMNRLRFPKVNHRLNYNLGEQDVRDLYNVWQRLPKMEERTPQYLSRPGSGQSSFFHSGSPHFCRAYRGPMSTRLNNLPTSSPSPLNTSLPPPSHRQQHIAAACKHHRCLYHLQHSHSYHRRCSGARWEY